MGRKPTRSFFKIFLDDSIYKLRLPPAFAKETNGVFPGKYVLKGPTGRRRSVKLNKVGEDLFFQDGWQTFVKESSLEFGDFLIFSFHRNSTFSIKIYGKNGCEKEVISEHRTTQKPTFCKGTEKQVKAVECFRGKHPDSQNRTCDGNWNKDVVVLGKRTRGCFNERNTCVVDIECEQVAQAGSSSRTEDLKVTSARIEDNLQEFPVRSVIALGPGPSYFGNSGQPNLGRGCDTHVEEDMEERSVEILGSSPECKALATPRKENLDIQVYKRHSVSRSYMTRRQTLTLRQKDGVIQAAKTAMPSRVLGCGPSYSKNCQRLKLEKRNEACVEEEVESKSVEILGGFSECRALSTIRNKRLDMPVAKRQSCSRVQMTRGLTQSSRRRNRMIQATGQPLCSVVLQTSYVNKGFVHFPSNFIQTHFSNKRFMKGPNTLWKNIRFRDSDGRIWPVKLICYSNRACISSGWSAFVRENNLREGDICSFELLKSKCVELKVSISRPQRHLGTRDMITAHNL